MKCTALTLSLIAACLLSAGCSEKPKEPIATAPVAPKADDKPTGPALAKLDIKDTKVGSGTDVAKPGATVYVTYVGKLANGEEFDGSEKHNGDPLCFTLGVVPPQVIKGWDQGLAGMKVGGERHLGIPAKLAYADHPPAGIPSNADLFFDVKLLDVIMPGDQGTVITTDIKKGSGKAAKDGDTVSVDYTGTLANGVKFDSSKDRNQAYSLKLGAHEVVPGFESGIVGMKLGGVRKLKIPPALGYGQSGRPGIPSNSILYFVIELRSIN